MRRQPTEKRIALTPRDIEILLLLARYRYLRSTHLYPLVGGKSARRFIERLGVLYHEAGYVNRPAQQWQAVNARYMPAVYELGEAGEQILVELGLMLHASPLLHRGRGNGMLFHHELMVSDILASIEIEVRTRADLRFVSWQEILEKAPEATRASADPFEIPVTISHDFAGRTEISHRPIRPDALFGIEFRSDGRNTYRFFALEADRASEPAYRGNLEQSSYLRKLLQYREVLSTRAFRSYLGVPNFEVLTVTTNDAHLRTIMNLFTEITNGDGNPHMLFRVVETGTSFERAPPPSPLMFNTPWIRVGHPETYINRP